VRLATLNLLNGTSLADRAVTPARLDEAVRELRADVVGLRRSTAVSPVHTSPT